MTRMVSILTVSLAVSWAHQASADAVTDWNANAGRAAVAACISPADDPLHESRMYAMMHSAIHDALNAIDRRSRPYAYHARVPGWASPEAAVAAAARAVLVSTVSEIPAPFPQLCRDAGIASAEADYVAALAAIPDGDAKALGIQAGRAAAGAIIALRAGDGSDTPLLDFDYPQGSKPGEYRFTPGVTFAFAPGWGKVTPFVLTHAAQFRARRPYHVAGARYARDFNEVKALGGDDMTGHGRTPEQTQIGLFWIESSPLAWNRLARGIAASKGLGLWENARLFGLLNLSMADGYIGSWESKYHYSFWRPVTAIHEAETDGNPDTIANPAWTPLQFTYPIPDHDSAHSVQGGAASEALKQFFGTDHISFEACSLTLPVGQRCTDASPVYRSYTRLSQAADENAVSRVYIGIHFRRATEEGVEHGRRIARRAAQLLLRPVH